MNGEHTVRSYDQELNHLTTVIARMGGLAEALLAGALEAMANRDSQQAGRIVAEDAKVDALEQEAQAFTVRMLALRQPMAQDLRQIVVGLKIVADLERIGDYAANVAKRTLVLNQAGVVQPTGAVVRLGKLVQQIVNDVLNAYVEADAEKALEVFHRDDEVDEMYAGLFRELVTYMMEDPRNITACTHLMFAAKNIERIGDHCSNIAENIHFMVHGTTIRTAKRHQERAGEQKR